MSLTNLNSTNPEVVDSWNVSQVVSAAGDGILKDGSDCQREFRDFLQYIALERLGDFTDFVLNNRLDVGGFVLQDIVNELGRRLGFKVENGRYRGIQGEVGFDGLWTSEEGTLLIEVKTTDTYRINLDTIANYANAVTSQWEFVDQEPSLLLVVGRQDTGDLEAQIRGSRHAWSTRIIGVSSLLRGALAVAEVDGDDSTKRLRRSLFPIEYTRVDHMVDLFFSVASDSDLSRKPTDEPTLRGRVATNSTAGGIERARETIVTALSLEKGFSLKPLSKARYVTPDGKVRFTIAVSKRYDRIDQIYLYAFTDSQKRFLEGAEEGYFVLGFEDRASFVCIEITEMACLLEQLNLTQKERSLYWHIGLTENNGNVELVLPKRSKRKVLTLVEIKCHA